MQNGVLVSIILGELGMYRYRVLYPDGQFGVRYGVQQAEALACGSRTTDVFFVSDCDIYYIHVNLRIMTDIKASSLRRVLTFRS